MLKKSLLEPINLVDETAETKEEISDFMSGYSKVESETVEEPIEETKKETPDKSSGFSIKDPDSNKKVTIGADSVMTGAMVMLLLNIVAPRGIAAMHNHFAKDYEGINHNDLKLTKTQIKELEPLADEVAKMIDITANPIVLFLAGLAGTYGLTYITMLKKIDKKKDSDETQKT